MLVPPPCVAKHAAFWVVVSHPGSTCLTWRGRQASGGGAAAAFGGAGALLAGGVVRLLYPLDESVWRTFCTYVTGRARGGGRHCVCSRRCGSGRSTSSYSVWPRRRDTPGCRCRLPRRGRREHRGGSAKAIHQRPRGTPASAADTAAAEVAAAAAV